MKFRCLATFVSTVIQIVFANARTSLNPQRRFGCARCLYRLRPQPSPCALCVHYSAYEPAVALARR